VTEDRFSKPWALYFSSKYV